MFWQPTRSNDEVIRDRPRVKGRLRRGWAEPRVRLVVLGFTASTLIVLVVLASRSSVSESSTGQVNAGPVILIVHVVEIVGIAVELLALLVLIALLLVSRRRRRKDDEDQIYHEPVRVPWVLKLILVAFPLLVAGGLIFALTRTHPVDQPLALIPSVLPPALSGSSGSVAGDAASGELGGWEVLIAIAVALLAFIAILRAFREPLAAPSAESAPDRRTRALQTAVSAGLRDARMEPEPRRAVIAAYATMEQLLSAQGLPRREVEAPREYMTRLFGELDISADALRTLTDLFEVARFSQHAIVPAAKERAIAALAVIERELQATP